MRPARRPLLALVLAGLALGPGCSGRPEEYTSAEGRFRIRLPGTPARASEPDLPRGVSKVTLEQPSGSFEVAWEDLPESDLTADQRLDAACDKGLEKLGTKAVSRRAITLEGGQPGREFLAAYPDGRGVILARLYLVGRRLYYVMASGKRWWVESPATRQALDSFRVVEE